VGGHGPAEIGEKQNGAGGESVRDSIEKRASEEDESDGKGEGLWPSKLSEGLKDLGKAHDFGDGIEKVKEHQDRADDAAGLEAGLRDMRCLRGKRHELFSQK
jgi:hypothetical protein